MTLYKEDLAILNELLDELEPGETVELRFYYGTQRETWDGKDYDADSWEIRLLRPKQSVLLGCGMSFQYACRVAIDRLRDSAGKELTEDDIELMKRLESLPRILEEALEEEIGKEIDRQFTDRDV